MWVFFIWIFFFFLWAFVGVFFVWFVGVFLGSYCLPIMLGFFYLITTSYWLNSVLFSYIKKKHNHRILYAEKEKFFEELDCNNISFLLKLQLWSLQMIVQNKYTVFSICCGIFYSSVYPLHMAFVLSEENMYLYPTGHFLSCTSEFT